MQYGQIRKLSIDEVEQVSGNGVGYSLAKIGGGIVAIAGGTGAILATEGLATAPGIATIGLGMGAITEGFTELAALWY